MHLQEAVWYQGHGSCFMRHGNHFGPANETAMPILVAKQAATMHSWMAAQTIKGMNCTRKAGD